MSLEKKGHHYRPNLPSDQTYLRGVSNTITAKDQLEDIHFDYLTLALESLGIDDDPYQLVDLNNLNPEPVKRLIEQSFERARDFTGDSSQLVRLWDYLCRRDETEAADLIFVFGGPGLNRAERAVELYEQGLAPRLMFSGNKASYLGDVDMPEADYYKKLAGERGVPAAAILTESRSINTPQNAANSVRLLKAQEFLPKKILAVSLCYHMRRAYLTLKSAADWQPVILRQPVQSARFTRDNFYEDEQGWAYVIGEYIKLYGARLMRHF